MGDAEIDIEHIKSVAESAQAEQSDWVTFHPLEVIGLLDRIEAAEQLLEEYHKFGLIIDSAVRYSERDTENTKAIGDLIFRHSNRHRAKAGGTDD
jgi:hypothetical protein